MKAAFIEQYGGPEVLKYGDLPDPVAASDEVVVDVFAASVNGADWKVRKQPKFPFALGRDFSGVGGAGGVASFAIQLAKHIGARMITTASAANHEYVRGLGADEIIDYNAKDFTQVVTGCDAVFDTVGGDVAQRSFAVVKPGGRAAFIACGPQAPKPNRSDVTSLRPPAGRARRHLERIAHLFQAGAIRPPEIKLYRPSEAADAHRLSESRHFRGKLVFQVR